MSMSAPSPLSRKRSSSGLVALLALCTFASGVLAESVMVPMADGTRLATHYHLPDDAGPWPVIVVRTVYGLGGIATEALTEQGYAVVTQYTRGRFDSEGTDMVFADDGWGNRRDGADTLAWVRAQPWCNGKIGTWGPSALGITQVMLAGADKNIAAQCIIVAASNFYDQVAYQGGVLRKNMIEKWLAGQKSLHVLSLWKSHPYYDEFWAYHDAEARAGEIGAPAIHYGGWFDIFAKGTINNFVTRQYRGGQGARGNQKLILGPWPHGTRQRVGDLTFPNNFNFELGAYQTRFYEYWLKGAANGIMDEPAVHYYVMGDCDNVDAPGNE